MRIAVLAGVFPGVSTTFILDQIVCAIEAGHDVDVYGTIPSVQAVQHAEVERHRIAERVRYMGFHHRARRRTLRIAQIAATLLAHPKSTGRVAKHAPSLKRLFDSAVFMPEQRYDVIHCHFGTTALRVLPAVDAGVLRGPLLVTFHGQDILRRPIPDYAALFRSNAYYTTNTHFLRNVATDLGCPPERVIKFPLGVNPQLFSVPETRAAAPRVLTVGRLVEMKGIEFGLRAFAQVLHKIPEARYDVCGDGPLRSSLERLAQELCIAQSVCFHGAASRQRIQQLMADASVFLLPGVVDSHGQMESQGVVLVEAQACGLPVITSKVGGVPEVVRDGETGFLVTSKDVGAFRDNLIRLLSDHDLRSSMGKQARWMVEQTLDQRVLNRRLLAIYERLASGQALPLD